MTISKGTVSMGANKNLSNISRTAGRYNLKLSQLLVLLLLLLFK